MSPGAATDDVTLFTSKSDELFSWPFCHLHTDYRNHHSHPLSFPLQGDRFSTVLVNSAAQKYLDSHKGVIPPGYGVTRGGQPPSPNP